MVSKKSTTQKILADFPAGSKLRITGLYGGRSFREKLSELGLFEGAEVEVIKNDFSGPIILKVFDSKIAIGRGQAQKTYVQET